MPGDSALHGCLQDRVPSRVPGDSEKPLSQCQAIRGSLTLETGNPPWSVSTSTHLRCQGEHSRNDDRETEGQPSSLERRARALKGLPPPGHTSTVPRRIRERRGSREDENQVS